jgi:DNA-binding NarL/FixJ family response regulator
MITLVLADDHPSTRAGLRTILDGTTDIQVVGEAEDGFNAEKLVELLRPRILLLDLIMPGPRPAEIERRVRNKWPETVTLVLTAHDRDAYLVEMMAEGVAGYLTKNESSERLINAIRRAAQGDMIFTEEQFPRALNWHRAIGNKWESLSEREKEILHLLGQGVDIGVMAGTLGISSKTVSHHLSSIYKKLGVNSRPEAMAWVQKYLSDNLE